MVSRFSNMWLAYDYALVNESIGLGDQTDNKYPALRGASCPPRKQQHAAVQSIKIKVKQSLYRPEKDLTVPEG